MNINEIERNSTYTISTKYPYELIGVMTNVLVVGIIYDYRVATRFKDVISEHTRIKQMNPSITSIDTLTFLIIKTNNEIDVLAYEYIEDMVLS